MSRKFIVLCDDDTSHPFVLEKYDTPIKDLLGIIKAYFERKNLRVVDVLELMYDIDFSQVKNIKESDYDKFFVSYDPDLETTDYGLTEYRFMIGGTP